MSLHPVRLLVRGLTLALVGAAVLLLSGVADQPAMQPVTERPDDSEFRNYQENLGSGEPSAVRATDAWDDEWHFLADGGKHGYAATAESASGQFWEAEERMLVRYGQNGYLGPGSWTYKVLAGDFVCSPETFGGVDPLEGVEKRCEVAQYWVDAVHQGAPIPMSWKGAVVRYGWGTQWAYTTMIGPGTCDVGLVGRDPAPYVNKICQVQSRPWGGVVASEGERYTIPAAVPGSPLQTDGGAAVRYGVTDHWVYKQVPAGTTFMCGVAFFGQGDPAWMLHKHCEVVTTMGAGVRIAVINQGHLPHPDLEEKLLYGVNTYDKTNNLDDCPLNSPIRGRGVMVAGIAAATTFNKIGIAGVAPMAKIEQVNDSRACNQLWGYRTLADAIRWSAGMPVQGLAINQDPAKVIILKDIRELEHCNDHVTAAIATARLAGSVLVVPAGDDGTRLGIDICPGVAVVAGIDRAGARVPSSNFGAAVDVSAPGKALMALLYSPNGGPTYGPVTTTSAAAAQYAGVAALMFGKNPALSRKNVERRIELSSRAFPKGCDGCGIGMLDADRAMRSAEAITTAREDDDQEVTQNYVSAPADIAGNLAPKAGWDGMCTVSQACCKNQTDPTCPQPTVNADQDNFKMILPPNQTLSVWIERPEVCLSDCFFDIAASTVMDVRTYSFGSFATYTNTSPEHEPVYIRVHSNQKPVLAHYVLDVMWRDERAVGGQLVLPTQRLDLR